jgi:hypothetical protein
MFTSFSPVIEAHQIKAHLMNFHFLFIVLPFIHHGLLEILLLAEGHPKNTVVDSPAALN